MSGVHKTPIEGLVRFNNASLVANIIILSSALDSIFINLIPMSYNSVNFHFTTHAHVFTFCLSFYVYHLFFTFTGYFLRSVFTMVFVCIVKTCENSKVSTKVEGCKLFSIPNDLSRCNKWLINCQRSDLCAKPIDILNKNYRVCNDHFNPTINYNETCIETTENDTTNNIIGDDSLPDASIVTSTPSKQNQSVFVAF
ncbi:52 kDa repressor of the inhibitor of the protein kinase-like, partial [Aphis craccivora]